MKKIISIPMISLLGLLIIAFSFFGVRQLLAKREIAAEWDNSPSTMPQLETTSRLGRQSVLDVMARLRKHTTIFYSTHILDDVQLTLLGLLVLGMGVLYGWICHFYLAPYRLLTSNSHKKTFQR